MFKSLFITQLIFSDNSADVPFKAFLWNIYSQFRKFSFVKILFNSERKQRKTIHIAIAMWSYVNTLYQCWMINKENWGKKRIFLFTLQIPFCICSRSSYEFVSKIFLLEGLRGSSHIATSGKSGSFKRKEIFLWTLILWIIFDNIFEI